RIVVVGVPLLVTVKDRAAAVSPTETVPKSMVSASALNAPLAPVPVRRTEAFTPSHAAPPGWVIDKVLVLAPFPVGVNPTWTVQVAPTLTAWPTTHVPPVTTAKSPALLEPMVAGVTSTVPLLWKLTALVFVLWMAPARKSTPGAVRPGRRAKA